MKLFFVRLHKIALWLKNSWVPDMLKRTLVIFDYHVHFTLLATDTQEEKVTVIGRKTNICNGAKRKESQLALRSWEYFITTYNTLGYLVVDIESFSTIHGLSLTLRLLKIYLYFSNFKYVHKSVRSDKLYIYRHCIPKIIYADI